jgi:hypothetical protein
VPRRNKSGFCSNLQALLISHVLKVLLSALPWSMDMKVVDFFLSANLVIVLSPLFLLSCAVPFWVWLKACKWLCCHYMYAASFQQFLIGDSVAWNHRIDRESWEFQAFAKPG